eukprot:CAMPEP_0201675952 /NCGR_PEP_ID=MMETSP0494-20130426/40732_1 /ASSEMBLY_ACC=CAM_ASM_000839 /TAXON_ID=420259 /ORGANISM="Thalassiosira gravida, Strain GMp14c1" /LENGTH=480 /DNA_ID=CAMNT_0048158549 /DNA_START=42 /DNA_END=1484 /DNA_ORIENTATION=-
MFHSLPDATLQKLVLAFEEVDLKKGDNVMKQGDTEIDYFYVIRSGSCSVEIDGKKLPDPYGTMTEGTILGELAMLYNNPRAATVLAKTNCKLYRVDRQSFRYFLDNQQPQEKENLMAELQTIDNVIDQIAGVKMRYSGDIIQQFRPNRSWLWRQWRGTVLQHSYKISLLNMVITAAISLAIRRRVDCNWGLCMAPDPSHVVINRMATFGKGWHYTMGLTTFILTFFLSQSYGMWRELYNAGRKIQGRLNDVGMLLATSADRDEEGRYTPAAEKVQDDVARASRLFHTFCWASFAKSFGVLLTPRGMSRMLSRGLMTQSEFITLQGADAKSAGAKHVCMEWMMHRALKGMKKGGGIEDDEAVKHVVLEELCALRGTYAGIGDILEGRMPLAYAHFVQILVDTFLVTAPVALYAEMGVWSVFSVGVITLFYSGLLSLAKIFLDPLGNDNFFNDSVNCDIGVFIRESNAGSTRWKDGISTLPV